MPHVNPWESALLDFMAIYSPTDHEAEAGAYLEHLLRTLFPSGIISTHEVAPNRRNICCLLPDSKDKTPLIFTSHYDTVPGELPVAVDSSSIFGRGACDAKGQVIAQIWGALGALERGMSGIALCFVVGEETDSLGARGLLDHLPNATYLVNGEPTGNKFVRLSWGAMDVVVTFNGISRHSSLGTHDSAIHGMISALVNLEKSAPSKLSINIGLLSGGTAANTTAPLASARLCVRYSLSTAECIQFLSANLPTKTFECLPPLEPLSLYVPDLHLTDAIEVKFGSDASIFHKRIPHVMMRGPGSIQFAHTDQEQINRNELHEAIRDLVSLSELLLG